MAQPELVPIILASTWENYFDGFAQLDHDGVVGHDA
eukprot:COSAG01_NODE_21997_length_876_cov_2.492921_1_plen_35_part_10